MAALTLLPSCSLNSASFVSSSHAESGDRRRSPAASSSVATGRQLAILPLNHHHHVHGRREAKKLRSIRCSAADGVRSSATTSTTEPAGPQDSWVPVIPYAALPRGERRLIRQDGDVVLLLWYKDDVYALENTSPAEGAYSEGLFNARLTADGCIVCPSTETTFDLKTGAIKDWYPTNPILAFLTRPTRELDIYPVKTDGEFVYINTKKGSTGQTAEIVFGGQTQAGRTATDVSVDEVRMVVDDNERGFGFTPYTELVNGRAAMFGFTALILTELVTGKGVLKGIGFLDFLYKYIK